MRKVLASVLLAMMALSPAAAQDGEPSAARKMVHAIENTDMQALLLVAPSGAGRIVDRRIQGISFDTLVETLEGCTLERVNETAEYGILGMALWRCEGRTSPDNACLDLGYNTALYANANSPLMVLSDGSGYSEERCGPMLTQMSPPPKMRKEQ